MSPRPKRLRRISNPPIISGFKPYGGSASDSPSGSVFLHYEEYEVLRLCDFEMLNHNQASVIMDISRPTFTRIYAGARAKIAEALVTGKQIIIEGGKVYFDSEWHSCLSCGCFFNQPDKIEKPVICPLCGSGEIEDCAEAPESVSDYHPHCDELCVCARCGYEKPHIPGNPCKDELCPDCGTHLVRKDILEKRNK